MFDPKSGLIYHLDFGLKKNSKMIKRVTLIRPIGLAKLLSNNIYDSSYFSKKINLLFSFREDFNPILIEDLYREIKKVSEFIDSVNILLVKKSQNFSQNFKINLKKNKVKLNEIRISKSSLFYNDEYVQLVTIRKFSKILHRNSLVFYMPLNVIFGKNILRRVLLNTMMGKQVFFPIAFNYYSFADGKFLNQINQDSGYFDQNNNQIVSFYNTDFIDNYDKKLNSVYELFKKSNLKIFKVVDNDLKCKWKPHNNCHLLSLNDSIKCMRQKQLSFADELTFFNFIQKN